MKVVLFRSSGSWNAQALDVDISATAKSIVDVIAAVTAKIDHHDEDRHGVRTGTPQEFHSMWDGRSCGILPIVPSIHAFGFYDARD